MSELIFHMQMCHELVTCMLVINIVCGNVTPACPCLTACSTQVNSNVNIQFCQMGTAVPPAAKICTCLKNRENWKSSQIFFFFKHPKEYFIQ